MKIIIMKLEFNIESTTSKTLAVVQLSNAHKGIVNAPCINIDSKFQKLGGKRLKKNIFQNSIWAAAVKTKRL